ncbi:hypothetical protein BK138_30625 [Paenibacillus rhizosphaerae]|uniref:Uncharacterized protein n=1 Tax=Paenibacillus rhizosphaerae TaxID=297318 RepID=A0A1R1EAS6_9BACL|nr:hypothetical protein [Paenibacillus rhizosphaerae]OMF48929.1 hypothetical protein BK138_30625 [Paenibacillus rhizosphaerae]
MGWSELRAVPNDYDEEIHAVDTQLIELLNHRKALAKGRRCFPPKEVMKEFEEKFDLKPPYLNWLFHSINGGFHRTRSDGPGELQGILQIMKTTVQEGYQYRITHAMQHEHGSIVHIEIRPLKIDNDSPDFHPRLQLEITSSNEEYNVQRSGARGGGGASSMSFLVEPRLPEQLDTVNFALIPFEEPMEFRRRETFLDQEVHFE